MDIILKLYKAPQITSKHTQETTFASRITLPILRHWHQGSKNPWPDGPGSPKTYTGQVDWLANGQSGPASAYEKIMFSLPLAYNLAAWHKHFPTVPIGQWTEKKLLRHISSRAVLLLSSHLLSVSEFHHPWTGQTHTQRQWQWPRWSADKMLL